MGKGIDNLRYREMEVEDGKRPDCCRAFPLFNI